MDSFILLGILISVQLTATFFMLKYRKKLPNPLGYVGNRTEKWLNSFITRYIASTMENFSKEPQLIAAMLKKPFRLLVDDMLTDLPKGVNQLAGAQRTGNNLVDIGQVILPMFGAKGKKLAQGLAFLPLLQQKGQSNETTNKPWG